jgi:hypothetical protein
MDTPDLAARLAASSSSAVRALDAEGLDPSIIEAIREPATLVPLAAALEAHARTVLRYYQPLLARVQQGKMRGTTLRELEETACLLQSVGLALATFAELPPCGRALEMTRQSLQTVQGWLPEGDGRGHLVASRYNLPAITDREVLERREEREKLRQQVFIPPRPTVRRRLLATLAVALLFSAINGIAAWVQKPARVEVPLAELRTVLPAATAKQVRGGDVAEITVRDDWASMDPARQTDQVLAAAAMLGSEGVRHVHVLAPNGRALVRIDDRGLLVRSAALTAAR